MARHYVYAGAFLVTLALGLSAGCQLPPAPAEPTVERVAVGSNQDQERLWEAVGDTLRAHFFSLDRQDRVTGVITTLPKTRAQAMEFWRPQPQPAYYWLEANIHTIRTQATVNLPTAPREDSPDAAQPVEVRVERYRYRLPERQVDNPAAALRIFSADAPTVSTGQMERPSETARWIPLGRDAVMERRLLADILRRYGSPAPDEPAMPQNP